MNATRAGLTVVLVFGIFMGASSPWVAPRTPRFLFPTLAAAGAALIMFSFVNSLVQFVWRYRREGRLRSAGWSASMPPATRSGSRSGRGNERGPPPSRLPFCRPPDRERFWRPGAPLCGRIKATHAPWLTPSERV